MLRKTVLLMFTLLILTTTSPSLLAENKLNNLSPKTSQPVVNKPYSASASALQHAIEQSGLYDYLSNHPDFLKIQEMVYRVWEKQTGRETRAAYYRTEFFNGRPSGRTTDGSLHRQ